MERFCGKSRYRIHILGEFRAIKVHFRFGENTVPCAEPDPCAYCADPQLWKTRREFCAAALLRDDEKNLFVPIVAIFTQGGFNKLARGEGGSHRGRLLDVWRVHQGMSKVLAVKETGRVEPPYPAFDIEPHLLRMWFPHDTTLPPVEVPPSVPFVPEAIGPRTGAPAEAFRMSEEARAMLRAHVTRIRSEQAADAPAPDTSTPSSVPFDQFSAKPELREGINAEAGPKHLVQAGITPELEEEALAKRSGQAVCGDYGARMAAIKAQREQAAATAPAAVGDLVPEILAARTNGRTPGPNGKHPPQKGGR